MVSGERAAQGVWPALAVSAAVIIPQFAPVVPAEYAHTWLWAGLAQSASQTLFLLVNIGFLGPPHEYGVRRPRLGDLPGAAILLAVLLAVGLTASAVLGGGSAGALAAKAAPGWPLPATLALAAAYAAAVGYREELFYRAWVLRWARRFGARDLEALAVSVLAFAAGHAYQGAAGMATSAVMGAVLAVAWLRGSSVHALAWAHGAYDFVILAALFTGGA
ncbi:MAG: CPBP family intramembrane metalloprotease [Spirochaetia bacterium]|nr:CPBP family intramembrane metalloprotease [Spirochaetia bacterium]